MLFTNYVSANCVLPADIQDSDPDPDPDPKIPEAKSQIPDPRPQTQSNPVGNLTVGMELPTPFTLTST